MLASIVDGEHDTSPGPDHFVLDLGSICENGPRWAPLYALPFLTYLAKGTKDFANALGLG